MKYELAKELKDAGFPQRAERDQWPEEVELAGMLRTTEMVNYPTLEELIEACGEYFIRFEKDGLEWAAAGWGTGDIKVYEMHFPTPTEAVARLWLALNPKKA